MSLPTVEEVTKLYLYGQKIPPNNPDEFVDDKWIRPEAEKKYLTVDALEYMAGPGRFALPSMSWLVKKFFSFVGDIPGVSKNIEYSKEDMASFLNLDSYGINFQQYSYDDGQDDFGERFYIWNSTAFKIGDKVKFVVAAEGKKFTCSQCCLLEAVEIFI